jgi:Holliday junction resolvase RusA-like endonuclease
MSGVAFTVYGKPQPAGSKRGFPIKRGGEYTGKVAVVDDAKGSRAWKQEVASVAVKAMSGTLDDLPFVILNGPLMLEVTFYLARPKSHYRTGKHAELLREAAPAYPTTRPDATKLVRAVEDAMTGIVWNDDAQVVTQVVHKRYGIPERACIRVGRIGADDT